MRNIYAERTQQVLQIVERHLRGIEATNVIQQQPLELGHRLAVAPWRVADPKEEFPGTMKSEAAAKAACAKHSEHGR